MKRLITLTAIIVAISFLAIACSKSGGGDPGDEMIGIMTDLLKVVKDNADDCGKAGKALDDWVASNKDKMTALAKKGKEMEKSMSDEDRKKYYEEKMKKKMEPLIKDMMGTMVEFGTKCPTEAQKIGEVMSVLQVI